MTINMIILPPLVIKPFVTPVQGVNAADVHSARVKYINKNKWNCNFSGGFWGVCVMFCSLVCYKNTNVAFSESILWCYTWSSCTDAATMGNFMFSIQVLRHHCSGLQAVGQALCSAADSTCSDWRLMKQISSSQMWTWFTFQFTIHKEFTIAWERVAIQPCSCVGRSRGLRKNLQLLTFLQLLPAGESW